MPPSPTVEATLRASTIAAEPSLFYSLPDLVCFAHLHWDFVWQRPQHLLSRFARYGRVFYVEDAFYHNDDLVEPHVEVKERTEGVKVVVVHRVHGQRFGQFGSIGWSRRDRQSDQTVRRCED